MNGPLHTIFLLGALSAIFFVGLAEGQTGALPDAPTLAPVVLPKLALQPAPHEARIDVDDPPCLTPEEDGVSGHAKGTPEQERALSEYLWKMKKAIYRAWLPNQPSIAKRPLLLKGTSGVKVTVGENGHLDLVFLSMPSRHPSMDRHALESVVAVSPLPHLPEGFHVLHACFFFYYNQPETQKKKSEGELANGFETSRLPREDVPSIVSEGSPLDNPKPAQGRIPTPTLTQPVAGKPLIR